MAEPTARPEGYGRRPTDGPEVSRAEIERREAARLNASRNGELVDGVTKPLITPSKSAT